MTSGPTLSLCMIARNEEAHLQRCLASVRALVDEIIFVDTGSTDRTLAIAESFGARIFHLPWPDDFSVARNYALERATGDWILSLDADESIAARDHARIRESLAQAGVDAALSLQRNYISHAVLGWEAGSGGYEEGEPYSGFRDVVCRRLFRNRPWLRFRNRVHEMLSSIDPARPLVETRDSWVIHHYGKVGDAATLEAKAEAYLRIGLAKIADNPDDPQAHYELGVQHLERSDFNAALACFQRTLEIAPDHGETHLNVAIVCQALARHDEAFAALRKASRLLPDRAAEIAFLEGTVHEATGNLASAERAYRRSLKANPAYAPSSVNLTVVLETQGKLDEALACLDGAIALGPRHTQLRKQRAALRTLRGDDAGALRDLEELGNEPDAIVRRVRLLLKRRQFADADRCLRSLGEVSDHVLDALRGATALGLGDFAGAVTHLQHSFEADPTYEAARNLSTALEAQGLRSEALAAAADALRLAPSDPHARARFVQLASDTLRRAAPRRNGDSLTVFFYQPHSLSYNGRTPRERGLGGTESAVVYLAEALARRGHRVVVLNGCDAAATIDGVEYERWESLPKRCVIDRPHVVVAVRAWEMIGRTRLAPLQIFWTGDAFDQPFVQDLRDSDNRREIDFVMLQSDWQAETFAQHHNIPAWQIVRTRLGSAASAADSAPLPPAGARPRKLAYASTPFRGLDTLLDVFPKIRAACPDAQLDVFSSMRVYGMSEEDDRRNYGALYAKAAQPGVNLIGSVPQPELARRLHEARVLAYPNHFAETFCIAAIEAQAAGCVVVTSAVGALPETIGDGGVCLDGDPHSAKYRQSFIDACISLLTDDERWTAMSARAQTRTRAAYTWPGIAEEWEAICRVGLREDSPTVERVAVHLAAGRAGLAVRMLERESAPDDVPADVWNELRALAAARAAGEATPSDESLRTLALHFPAIRRTLNTPAVTTQRTNA
jgi:glycosyltransferase involved in cell wall biosynthesis/Flp pilus assembly protein TadD